MVYASDASIFGWWREGWSYLSEFMADKIIVLRAERLATIYCFCWEILLIWDKIIYSSGTGSATTSGASGTGSTTTSDGWVSIYDDGKTLISD